MSDTSNKPWQPPKSWRGAAALVAALAVGGGIYAGVGGETPQFLNELGLVPGQANSVDKGNGAGGGGNSSWGQQGTSARKQQISSSGATTDTKKAREILETLPVAKKAPFNDYKRTLFMEEWGDLDGNDCNTRNEILARDLENVEFRRVKPRNCVVQSGVLHDDYSGLTIEFERAQGKSDEVQIDHVVALGNVWRTGGQDMSREERQAVANDPLNLLAVDGDTNQEKESKDASQWLPPREDFHCEYVARQIAVKAKYHLWVTPAERDAMREVLSDCPEQDIPVD